MNIYHLLLLIAGILLIFSNKDTQEEKKDIIKTLEDIPDVSITEGLDSATFSDEQPDSENFELT